MSKHSHTTHLFSKSASLITRRRPIAVFVVLLVLLVVFSGTASAHDLDTSDWSVGNFDDTSSVLATGDSRNDLHVRKYNDLNGNGDRDSGEPYLNGWTIEVYRWYNNYVGSQQTRRISGNDGRTKFELSDGWYKVCEIVQDGWENTEPGDEPSESGRVCTGWFYLSRDKTIEFGNHEETPPQTGSLHVFKFNDLNGNGEQDDGEEGLNDWTFTLTGQGGEFSEMTMNHPETNEPGWAWFTNIPVGDYLLCETVQDGWEITTPNGAEDDDCIEVAIAQGAAAEIPGEDPVTVTSGNGNSFTIEFLGTSNGGLTWNYRVSETGDKSLSHWVLDVCGIPTGHSGPGTYTDEHINGQADPTTGVNGVKWDLPENYDNSGGTEDDTAIFSVTFDEPYGATNITVAIKTGGQGVKVGTGTVLGPDCEPREVEETVYEFGNRELLGSLHVLKYHDYDGNGRKGILEPGLNGWWIVVYQEGQEVARQETHTIHHIFHGWAWFDLPAGRYEVCEEPQEGWINTDPGGDRPCQWVEVRPDEEIVIDFGNLQLGHLHVQKFNDVNGNGQRDDGDEGLNGWTITVYNIIGQPVASDVTHTHEDEDGWVWFSLRPSILPYFVCEDVNAFPGWINTFPGGHHACHAFFMFPGEVDYRFFGNHQLTGSITIVKESNPTAPWLDFDFTSNIEGHEAFSLNGGNNVDSSETFNDLPIINTYTFSESRPGNWDLTSVTCDGGDWSFNQETEVLSVDLTEDGQDVTCTFVNERRPQIKIRKYFDFNLNGEYDNETGLPDWDFLLFESDGNEGWSQVQGTRTTNGSGIANFTNLEPGGSFLLCEVPQEGWDNSDPGDAAVEIEHNSQTLICRPVENLQYGEVREVFFGNYELATITIVKDSIPNHGRDWRYNGDLGQFRLDDDANPTYPNSMTFEGLQPGEDYTVTETNVLNNDSWDLTDIVCDSNSVNIDLDTASVTITPLPGEHVTCTFINERRGGIRVRKYWDINGDGDRNNGEPWQSGWEFTVYDDEGNPVDTRTTNNNGQAVFNQLPEGTYTVCETPQDDWTATEYGFIHGETGEACYEVEVVNNQTTTVEFGNYRRLPPERPEGETCISLVDYAEQFASGENVDGFEWDGLVSVTSTTNQGVSFVVWGELPFAWQSNGAPNNYTMSGYGLQDITRIHDYVFNFPANIIVTHFSVRVYDLGDYNPAGARNWSVALVGAGTGVGPSDGLAWAANTIGDAGDSFQALIGQPGNRRYAVSGSSLTSVVLNFGHDGNASYNASHVGLVTGSTSADPHIGIDELCITYRLPEPAEIEVTKTPSVDSVERPGDNVTFTVTVENLDDTYSVEITSLVDDVFGDLNGQGTCSVPQTLAAGASYQCEFVGFVAGEGGDVHVNVVTAEGVDENENPVSDNDDAVVEITGPNCEEVPENPTADLVHSDSFLIWPFDHGQVHNRSECHGYYVGIASYQIYDGSVATQTIFDYIDGLWIGPGETIDTATHPNGRLINLPACWAQVDLFYGDAILDFSTGDLYLERLIDSRWINTGVNCNPPANDPPQNDPPQNNPPANDPPANDPPANDPPANDPPQNDPPQNDPPVCVPNPDGDLKHSGSHLNPPFDNGTVTNLSDACTYEVGIASYRVMDGTVATQQILGGYTVQIGPGETVNLGPVPLASCTTQVDLFYGHLITDFSGGERYGNRLIDVRWLGSPFCGEPPAEQPNEQQPPANNPPANDPPQNDPPQNDPPVFDDDGDGVPDDADQCPGTGEGVEVDGNGCSAEQRTEGNTSEPEATEEAD